MPHLLTRICTAALFSALTTAATAQAASSPTPKVLLVVSSEGQDEGKTRPGFEMDEYARAYLVLRANGLAVEVASPAGGAVQADRYNPQDDHIQVLQAEAQGLALLKTTRRTQDVRVGDHEAIFVIGGKGAMFDLPRDTALQQLLAAHHARGGVLAAVCHGPAALVAVTLADGTPLVKGRRMTGFTDEEETVFGKRWAKEYPFWLEAKMRALGAQWDEAALMLPKTVVDGRLITGQNPFSTTQTAEAVVRALGRTPVASPVFKEDASLALVQRWLAAESSKERDAATAELAQRKAHYKPDLIGILGVYQFKAATDTASRERALSIMEFALPHMPHPKLKLSIAEAHAALGRVAQARKMLAELLADKPDFAEARQALEALPS
jgi:putative intracellular protease/amidase